MYLKFGLQLPHYPLDLILKAARFAEEIGFDYVLTPDHLVGIGIRNFDCYESFSLLGAISTITSKVKIGTCVSDVLRRHPAVIAQFASTLQSLSGGRAVLGLGLGEGMNLIPYGIETKNLISKFEEGVKVIKMLLTMNEVDFEGKFFKLKRAFVKPKMRVPIWIAGNSERTVRVATLGDGWIPTASVGVKNYKRFLEFLRKHNERIEAALFAYTLVKDSYEEAVKEIELPAKMLSLLSPLRDSFLEKMGLNVDIPHLIGFTFTYENVKRLREIAEKIPFELVEERFFYGTVDDVIDKIEMFRKAGAETFVFCPLVRVKGYLDVVKRLKEILDYYKCYG